MSNENMGFDQKPGEEKLPTEKDPSDEAIITELEGLQGGLADVQQSLENVDQSLDTPERMQILKKIYASYLRIAVVVDSTLGLVGGAIIVDSFYKVAKEPQDFSNVGKMFIGIITAAAGLSGFIARRTKELEDRQLDTASKN